ncbi:secreted pullulanase [Fontibacillus phaseoli]|uniref:pullulanase n=1 Tax=Fontibacillus phaseoli TaxID=1416533 RepID=A0A369BP30_9BACL|nr:pullulanase [Fontibacillus phaseoli]RCX22835.1 secreted pullulanase [Fontibacillus phaseoli]
MNVKLKLKGKAIFSFFMIISLMFGSFGFGLSAEQASADADQSQSSSADDGIAIADGFLRIHYNGNIEGMGLWFWGDVAEPSDGWSSGASAFDPAQADLYGHYVDVRLGEGAKKVGFLVVHRTTGEKEGGDKNLTLLSPDVNEVWIKSGSDQVFSYEPVDLPGNTVRIHYTRDDQNYDIYGLWLWGDVAMPSDGWPGGATPFVAEQTDRYGAYVDVPLQPNAKKISFLVVNRNNGDEKDGGDKVFSLADRYNRLWIKQGDNNVYVSPYGEVPVGLVSAEVLSESKLLLGFTMTDGLDPESLKNELAIKDIQGNEIPAVQAGIVSASAVEVEVSGSSLLAHLPLSVTYSGRTVAATTGWRMLDEVFYYDGNDLGATYHDGGVAFKLWAPTASSVTASVYDKDDATRYIGSIDLSLGEQGVWTAEAVPSDFQISDLKGYFYQYYVTNQGVTKAVLDPYAKSMAPFRVDTSGKAGSDGDIVGKAAIVNLNGTDPDEYGYAQIDGYEQREDAVIWEIHVRDFTSDPSVEGDLNGRWGSYKAFGDKLDYLKSLGVTHVQLMPVMAWYYGDETSIGERELDYSAQGNEYNWGYDPHNYFSPDGAYSENPADPQLRIEELKGLIDAVHDAGMGVILDVVYTHMAKADFLNDIVPGYYAWKDANGNNVGGFGNNLATNHKMAEKLMVDSVKYWFDEYKIDGMRWDMMGDATYEAVQHAYDEAAKINPDALFIGEGWRTFSGGIAEPALDGHGATQDWMNQTDNVGVFSDEIRNELKSGYGSEGEPRFITGGARPIESIFNNIKAQPSNTPADDPGDMVSYIEAHDNLPLYDVIAQSIKKDPAVPANDLEIHKRIRLGNLLIMTSQGSAFLHAGQEYGRTKQWKGDGAPEQKYHELKDESGHSFGYFVHDSYDSSDAINMFDWAKATDAKTYPVNHITREYTSGLISLRKSTNAFTLGNAGLVDQNITLIDSPEIAESDKIIAYKNKATDGSGNYYVFVNADSVPRTLTLQVNLTEGKVLVDNDEAGSIGVTEPSGFRLTSSSITLEPLTAVVINKQDSGGGNPGNPDPGNGGGGTGTTSSGSASSSQTAKDSALESLKKQLDALPSGTAEAAEKIVKELDKLGTVASLERTDKDGKKIIGLKAVEFQSALDRLTKGLDLAEQHLGGNAGLLNNIKSAAGMVIDIGGLTTDTVELSLPGPYLAKLKDAGIALKVRTANAMISIPAGTGATGMDLSQLQEMTLGFAPVSGTESQRLLSNAEIGDRALKPAGKIISFTGFTVDASGNGNSITAFDGPVVLSLTMTAEEMKSLGDKRKSGLYQMDDDGFVQFRGGKFENGGFVSEILDTGYYTVMESVKTFKDSADTWAKEYIEISVARGITTGIDKEHFAPQAAVTRGQMAVFLGRALKLDEASAGNVTFTDVDPDAYYHGFIAAMKQAGILAGYEDGSFRPDQKVTREEMLTMVMKAHEYTKEKNVAGLPIATPSSASFADEGDISNFALGFVKAARELGLISGTPEGKFAPQDTATRDQMAKVLTMLMEITGQF